MLLARGAAANGTYASARPFPHGHLDGLFPPHVLEKLDEEFPDTWPRTLAERLLSPFGGGYGAHTACEHARHRGGWRCILYPLGGWIKMTNTREGSMGPYTQGVIQAMKSPLFMRFLETTTGIRDLHVDWTNEGNGLHQIMRGGYLQVGCDAPVGYP